MYLRSSNSLHIILVSVLCKKIKQYWLKFDASGQRSNRLEPSRMVQPIRHNCSTRNKWQCPYHMVYKGENRSGNDINKMVALFCTSTSLVFCKLFEGIWNDYVDIEQKIMQFRFIISLCTWGYISLGNPTWQHEVWRKTRLNTNWSKQHLTATAKKEQNDLNFC